MSSRAYEKPVDVVISRWDRGPEVLISTKAQLSSFGKNLPNRFEESYGDAGNLRDIGATATALLVVEWDATADEPVVTVYPDDVPDDAQPNSSPSSSTGYSPWHRSPITSRSENVGNAEASRSQKPTTENAMTLLSS